MLASIIVKLSKAKALLHGRLVDFMQVAKLKLSKSVQEKWKLMQSLVYCMQHIQILMRNEGVSWATKEFPISVCRILYCSYEYCYGPTSTKMMLHRTMISGSSSSLPGYHYSARRCFAHSSSKKVVTLRPQAPGRLSITAILPAVGSSGS
jgi:hypothetical protein